MLLALGGCGRISFDAYRDGSLDAVSVTPHVGARTISAGGKKTCSVEAGAMYCWGWQDGGGLGDGQSAGLRLLPQKVTAPVSFLYAEAGDGAGCGLVGDGTAWCWGRNTLGQLGLGFDANVLTPMQLVPADIEQISVGYSATCIRHRGGGVSCAGDGPLVGDGTGVTTYSFMPVLDLTDAIDITAGDKHACALRASGAAVCWGENAEGQLGDGTRDPHASPVDVLGGPYDDLAAGDLHTCARRLDGHVDCWGSGERGALGNGGTTDSLVPVEVVGVTDADAIAAGALFSCVLRSGGVATCWGSGTDGSLGDGTIGERSQPANSVSLADIVELSARTSEHVCARTGGGDVYCWGDNLYGQIGDGTSNNDRSKPVPITFMP
jgi:alpha-tubulin suppressor-like RCC1 family protein